MKRKIFLVVVSLLSIELVLQLVSLSRYLIYKASYKISVQKHLSDNWFLGQPGMEWRTKEIDGLYADYHPLLGWLPRPLKGKHININNERIRKTTGISAQTLPQLYMFGGSTLWGMNVGDTETIPSMISQKENAVSPKVTVTNYGQIGYNLNQEVAFLQLLLKQNKIPKMVLFYDGCNDLFYNLDEKDQPTVFYEQKIQTKLGNMWQYFQPAGPKNLSIFNVDEIPQMIASVPTYLKLYYYPARLIEKVFVKLGLRQETREPDNIPPAENFVDSVVTNYKNNAGIIDALSRAYGFQYALLWQPLVFTKNHVTEKEHALYTFSPLHPDIMYPVITNRLLGEHIKNFYDISRIFDGQTESLFYDECHIAPQGNKIIADKIVEIIQKDFQF